MNKIKKTFELILYIIGIAALLGVIAYIIVGSILWGWNGLVEQTAIILSMPVPIIGCTVMYLLIATLVVLSKTSFGRKALKGMKEAFNKASNGMKEAKEELSNAKQEFQTYKELKEQQIKQIKDTYEVLLTGVKQEKDRLENLVLEIGENIHNGKVEKAINEYVDNKKTQVNNEISEIVEIAKDEARSEYVNEINNLRHELEDLKQLVATNKESV